MDFDRSWNEYRQGFGVLEGEFWWGNEKLRSLTETNTCELVITLEAFDGDVTRARYGEFKLNSEKFVIITAQYEDLSEEGMQEAGIHLLSRNNLLSFLPGP